jgi:hypothetical protein
MMIFAMQIYTKMVKLVMVLAAMVAVGGTNGYGGGQLIQHGGGGAGWKGDGADGATNSGGHSFANGGSGGTAFS